MLCCRSFELRGMLERRRKNSCFWEKIDFFFYSKRLSSKRRRLKILSSSPAIIEKMKGKFFHVAEVESATETLNEEKN